MDPVKLLLLLALREGGSVTRAAELTGRTPPAVSQQLARLEREAGTALVERLPHGVRLTSLGEQLAERADRIAHALRGAEADRARHLRLHRTRLRLGAFPTAGVRLLPEALAALNRLHPDSELSVVDLGPTEGNALVAERELDLALVASYGEPLHPPAGVRLVPLLDDPVLAVLPERHPAATGGSPLVLRDFAADAWACAPRELPNRRQLDDLARTAGFTPHVPFESESYAVAQAVVSAGVAVAFLPRLAIGDVPGTVTRELDESALFRRVHAVLPAHSPTELAEVFLGLLRDVCAEHGGTAHPVR
ncbi:MULTISPECIES: LysR family transcriptional regulator [unclassified Saccharopolyspora]|uniref:LysR family transcriptional regulator n=1 Tax=unclassified Saccharopolyspora TaxID=2646250 RepID=UPI001CD74D05|nr:MULTISPECIES: LysR family transcriptional regulator [unclassified Saccharopolyspora]MCA1190882.1 LysR family transcriptional regulator [Saccharopolyspora sp. 6V]MCA1225536.1 LysR family transcriptional regulator [Saccharopolyspora sp. 6M]MCA1278792.1 LysR family transcriptional regulator [Saccharopolyspora sp. 7B]